MGPACVSKAGYHDYQSTVGQAKPGPHTAPSLHIRRPPHCARNAWAAASGSPRHLPPQIMSLDRYIGFLSSWSPYAAYRATFPQKEDPLIELRAHFK